ncbi:MAG: hypothetical protein V4805_20365, partial [Pseudomonadota bacterium]
WEGDTIDELESAYWPTGTTQWQQVCPKTFGGAPYRRSRTINLLCLSDSGRFLLNEIGHFLLF